MSEGHKQPAPRCDRESGVPQGHLSRRTAFNGVASLSDASEYGGTLGKYLTQCILFCCNIYKHNCESELITKALAGGLKKTKDFIIKNKNKVKLQLISRAS